MKLLAAVPAFLLASLAPVVTGYENNNNVAENDPSASAFELEAGRDLQKNKNRCKVKKKAPVLDFEEYLLLTVEGRPGKMVWGNESSTELFFEEMENVLVDTLNDMIECPHKRGLMTVANATYVEGKPKVSAACVLLGVS